MNKNYSTLLANFSVDYESESNIEDTRFLPITIDVLHTGENYNGSVFEKNVVDKCIDSIKNTPVLGFIDIDKYTGKNDFEGHEYIITKDENGTRRKYIGNAFGVISESCNPRWITKESNDGVTREYLQVDALLWRKIEDATEIMERDLEKAQSMELEVDSIEGYEDEETGLFYFTNFQFNGCCLISKEPAMIDSVAYVNKEVEFSMGDFVKSIQKELNDKYTTFTKMVNVENKGGNETMQNKDNAKKPTEDFALSIVQQFENIANIVKEHEIVIDRWGDRVARYCLVDIQDNEVIVVDRNNNYQYYGFAFTVDGDVPNIDFSTAIRKKISYTNYEETSSDAEEISTFGKEIEEIENKAFSKVENMEHEVAEAKEAQVIAETNYSQIKTEYDEIKPKYDEYVHDEKVRQENELNAKKDAEFARFENSLGENEDFISLKEKKADMSVEEITAQCSILFTRINLKDKANFSKPNNMKMTLGVIDNSIDEENGYVETKYGNIPVKR